MKKLMTMLAAVGMAFGLFAVGDPIVDTVDFSAQGYNFYTDTQWTYNGEAITAPTDKVWVGDDDKLHLATGSNKVSRTFVAVGAAEVVSNVYFDANINFEDPFDEAPVVTDANAKIAAFVLDNSGVLDDIVEKGGKPAVGPSTNLYVIAGYNNNGVWVKRAFMFATPELEGIASKTLKRLTIKAYGDVMAGSATRMGFRFFLNGDTAIKDALAVKYVFPINDIDGSIDFTTFIDADDTTTPYLGTGVKDSLEAAVRSRCSDQTLVLGLTEFAGTLSGFDLAGKGELANFTLTTASPAFIDGDSQTVTLNLTDAQVTVTGAIDYDQSSITFARGDSITVTATYTEGRSDIVKWTKNGSPVTPTDDSYSWMPNNNDVLAISAKAAGAYVDGEPFESFFGDDGALAYVNENGGTLKLAADVVANPTASEAIAFNGSEPIILDLAGKTIKGSKISTGSITVGSSATLTITNSTGTGHVAVPVNDEQQSGTISVACAGTLTIAEGVMDGQVSITANATSVSITGGTFDDVIANAAQEGVLETIGGLFNKNKFAQNEIPGVDYDNYEAVDNKNGYWLVQEIETYAITVDQGVNGTVAADKATAAAGETVTVTATPDANYHLVSIMTNNTPLAQGVTTFEMPAEAVTVSATFALDTFTVTFVLGNGQDNIVSNDVPYGTAFDAVKPADPTKTGYNFTGWNPVDATITAEKTYTAQYDEILVTSIELNVTETNLVVGESFTLTATAKPETAYDRTVTFSLTAVEPAGCVTINDDLIAAVSAGTATITATNATSGKTATCVVTVSAAPTPTPVPVDPSGKNYNSEKEAQDAAAAINNAETPAAKAALIADPFNGISQAAKETYASYVEAVQSGTNVKLALNKNGETVLSNQVATAVKAIDIASVAGGTADEATVANPIPGMWYNLVSGQQVTPLSTGAGAKQADGKAITFLVNKTVGATAEFFSMRAGLYAADVEPDKPAPTE